MLPSGPFCVFQRVSRCWKQCFQISCSLPSRVSCFSNSCYPRDLVCGTFLQLSQPCRAALSPTASCSHYPLSSHSWAPKDGDHSSDGAGEWVSIHWPSAKPSRSSNPEVKWLIGYKLKALMPGFNNLVSWAHGHLPPIVDLCVQATQKVIIL